MRILHFSDLHIGVENYGRTDPSTGLSTRLLDFLSSFDELVEYALVQQVDLVLLAGDAYKGRDPSQTHQREFAKRLARLSAAGIPVFLLVGNHDLPNAVGRATAIEIFHTLQVPGLYVGDSLQTYTLATRNGPIQIVAVPWPRRSRLLSREEARSLTIEQARQRIEELFAEGVELQVQALDPDVPAVLTGHVTVNGATTGTERSMMLGQDHALYLSALSRRELDYVALGHIHKHQVLRDDPKVVYSGSLERVDFSEEKDEKGFCVVDLDPSAPRGHRLQDFQFQRVDARPFLTIDVTVLPGDDDPTATVVRSIMSSDVRGAIVRLRMSLPADLDHRVREQDLRHALSGAHYVAAITRDVDQDRRTRIPATVAEGLTPIDALRLYLEGREMEPERRKKVLGTAEELVSAELDEAPE
ncbi:MAG: exonuclease SbcCD subunit D [Dehalococcoidia bacterium]|nr:exonuclease SbcCD subunit D [Dehalococcoidia bacterium]